MTIYLIRGNLCICYKNCKELNQWLNEVELALDLAKESSLTHKMTIEFCKKLYNIKYLNNLVQLQPIWLIQLVRKADMFRFCYNPSFHGECITRQSLVTTRYYMPTPSLTIRC
jgi:hypothetical protein